MSIAEQKKTLRTTMLRTRRTCSPTERQLHSQTICRTLAARIETYRANSPSSNISILSYMAMDDEVDITALHEIWLQAGIRIYLPRVVPNRPGELTVHEVFVDSEYELNRWGIREPVMAAGQPESIAATTELPSVDVLLVPGVAYDRTGVRLGFGGGFYDRLWQRLVRAGRGPYVIAPAFSFQILAHVPHEEHDLRVHEMVTEQSTELGVETDGGSE
jgi:5-formyltetrahydrofolate cyclo-ligase